MNLFSSEQVSKYHPDKYADQISDAILTEHLKKDKLAHVACETMVKDNTVVIAGEITSDAVIDYEAVVKRVADKLNYKVDKIINLISKQSPEIKNAVESSVLCAGDQGIMFGFASSETESYLPLAFDIANDIIHLIENDVENNQESILKGDAKTQVTVNKKNNTVNTIVISVCHKEGITFRQLYAYMVNLLSKSEKYRYKENTLIINPSGLWTIGGPTADCGLTGRKIVCDQYGGFCEVGGGAFSGKDPTKVDRSGSYIARKIAVDLCKKFNRKFVKVQIGYGIGIAKPLSFDITSNLKNNDDLYKYVNQKYDLTPDGIIKRLDLYNIDYEKLAEGCHYRADISEFKMRKKDESKDH